MTYADAAGPLVVEELRGGEGAGPDRVLGYVDPGPVQPGLQVARGVDRVVRQQQERPAGRGEPGDEVRGAGDRLLLVDEHAVHVGEPGSDRALGGCGRLVMPAMLSERGLAGAASRCVSPVTAAIAMPVKATASASTWTAPARPGRACGGEREHRHEQHEQRGHPARHDPRDEQGDREQQDAAVEADDPAVQEDRQARVLGDVVERRRPGSRRRRPSPGRTPCSIA